MRCDMILMLILKFNLCWLKTKNEMKFNSFLCLICLQFAEQIFFYFSHYFLYSVFSAIMQYALISLSDMCTSRVHYFHKTTLTTCCIKQLTCFVCSLELLFSENEIDDCILLNWLYWLGNSGYFLEKWCKIDDCVMIWGFGTLKTPKSTCKKKKKLVVISSILCELKCCRHKWFRQILNAR